MVAGAKPPSTSMTNSRRFPAPRPEGRNLGSSSACCGVSPKSSTPTSVSYTADVIQALPAAPTASTGRRAAPVPWNTIVGASVLP